jgi:hypothetical protein
MHNLPGGMIGRVELPSVASVSEHGVNSLAEAADVSRFRLG